ncbi:hypothetical protein M422DRAFT_261237 [Sphaerobolus stellatus SS14]|uniref:Uncharacterized protein n=1 Tax=Sphaerobolus stellatus (strain SS14) TaxID=990650 RepID=A0A0C9U145_SPHS4|nr:hypothetical protein M422DRAFT_261237 [Sphaerobolus stellatus SS14]
MADLAKGESSKASRFPGPAGVPSRLDDDIEEPLSYQAYQSVDMHAEERQEVKEDGSKCSARETSFVECLHANFQGLSTTFLARFSSAANVSQSSYPVSSKDNSEGESQDKLENFNTPLAKRAKKQVVKPIIPQSIERLSQEVRRSRPDHRTYQLPIQNANLASDVLETTKNSPSGLVKTYVLVGSRHSELVHVRNAALEELYTGDLAQKMGITTLDIVHE